MSIRKTVSHLVLCVVFSAGLCLTSDATVVVHDGEGNVTIYGTEEDDFIHVNQESYPGRDVYISFVIDIGWNEVIRIEEVVSVTLQTYGGDDLIVFRTSLLGGDLRGRESFLPGSPYILG